MVSESATVGTQVVMIIAKDATGFEFFQNYAMIGTNTLFKFKPDLKDIEMSLNTEKKFELPEVTNYDGLPVKISYLS